MKNQKDCDKILLATTFLLVIFGLIMISSASVIVSYNNFGYNYYYLSHQFFYGFIPGMVLLFLFQKTDYHIFKKYALFFLVATIVLLLLVFIPSLGQGLKGANRWIVVGDLSFQPSEIVKLTFIIYLSAWLERRNKKIRNFSEMFLPFIALISIIAIPLVLQPDIGTLSVIILTAVIIYFTAGARISHIFLLALSGMAALFALIKIAPYRADRLMVFLHPEIDPQGIGYQINQALLALGSGGIFGLGFGHSRQKFNYLPEPIGDSIFAITGEELGLVGLVILMVFFLVFALRSFEIARQAPDNFGKFMAVGISSWITFQALINMAAITALIPLTGIPMPFISYGGSALIASLAGVGILLSISRHNKYVS